MASLMSIGLSGLQAYQRSIDTTGHNIANVNTEGYSRQRVEYGTRPATQLASGWIGSGVDTQTVRRLLDVYLVDQARSSGTVASGLGAYAAQAERLNNLLGDGEAGLAASVQSLRNALEGLASEPGSIAARQVLLAEARGAVDRLKFFDSQMRRIDGDLSRRVAAEVAEVSTLAAGIARLNGQIERGLADSGQPPNDLLDARDRLLDQLAAKVNVTTVTQDAGTVNVFIGRGQALVLDETAVRLSTRSGAFDPARPAIVIDSPQGATDVTESITGGQLGGLLDFRRELLDPARNELGLASVGIAAALNGQHRLGMDLVGALGGDLLAVGGAVAAGASGNTGSGSIAIARETLAGLTTADYELRFTAGSWTLRRLDTGASVPLTGAGTTADPLRADGLAIVVGGSAVNGDRFLIRPVVDAAAGLAVRVTDPARIAAALPVRAQADAQNAGDALAAAPTILDPADPQLRATVTIEFLSPGTYSINGAGSFAYTSGQAIARNGWSVAISGTPAAGDRFSVADNAGATGDNRNALVLADVLSRKSLETGTVSVDGVVERMIGGIGVGTRLAQVNRDAQTLLYQEAVEQRANAAGVNLDEEAANLIRFQQAYQAAASVIRVANELFDSLLDMTR